MSILVLDPNGTARDLPSRYPGACYLVGCYLVAWSVSFGLHMLALSALAVLVSPNLPAPAPQVSFAVLFAAPASRLQVSASQAEAVMPAFAALAVSPLAYAPSPARVPRPVRMPAPHKRYHVVMFTTARAASAVPPALPGPRPAPDNAAAIAALESRISQAVNAAKFYPQAARQMRRQGRTAISFAYRNGGVVQVALAQTSRLAMLDNAALEAVRRAHYPAPPSGLTGETLHLRVWVDFSLMAAD